MEESRTKLYGALTILSIIVAMLVIAMIITEIKNYRFIGGGVSATNTIAVSGESEVYATPDIATITFSIREESKKLADAQDKVNKKVQTALSEVRKAGIAEKDIKLQNYSSYPKYEWRPGNVSCTGLDCPPYYPGKQVLIGYEVSQSVIITVRNLDAVNALVDGLGTAGVTDMQGPDFAIDKKDALEAQARKQAIDKARAKAEVLADDLNVTLVRVVSFSEGGNYPIYARPMMSISKESLGGDMSVPELPKGEEKITSNVTITYEIR